MQDMRRTAEDWKEASPGPASMAEPAGPQEPSDYYGLNISLENPELKKLGLETDEVQVGDMIHIVSMAVVTSVSKRDTGDGACCRVELALRNIAAEDEDEEGEETETQEGRLAKLYK